MWFNTKTLLRSFGLASKPTIENKISAPTNSASQKDDLPNNDNSQKSDSKPLSIKSKLYSIDALVNSGNEKQANIQENKAVADKKLYEKNVNLTDRQSTLIDKSKSVSVIKKNTSAKRPKLLRSAKHQCSKEKYLFDVIDLTADVKHASTPLMETIGNSPSPQLPLPSPNYPIQSQINTENCKPMRTDIIDNDTQLPNNNVPMINNNYITPHITSQTDINNENLNNNVETDSEIKTKHFINNNDINNIDFINNNKDYNFIIINNDNPENEETNHYDDILRANNYMHQSAINNEIAKISFNQGFTVLNIPRVVISPPLKKARLSKIDLATAKRKARRESRPKIAKPEEKKKSPNLDFGLKIYGYSDSSSEEEYSSDSDSDVSVKNIDLWIKSGPPLKEGFSNEKIDFMQSFGLTTENIRNGIELEKLERRKWLPILNVEEEIDGKVSVSLPVPSESPSGLNYSEDFQHKRGFLQLLGLNLFPKNEKYEFENNWLKVVEQRAKRNSQNHLNNYYIKSSKQLIRFFQEEIKHPLNQPDEHKLWTPLRLPKLFPQFSLPHDFFEHAREELFSFNNKPFSCLKKFNNIKCHGTDLDFNIESNRYNFNKKICGMFGQKYTWPGVEEIITSYKSFSKCRDYEISIENRKHVVQKQKLLQQQSELKMLESKEKDLCCISLSSEQKKAQLCGKIDKLTKIIKDFNAPR